MDRRYTDVQEKLDEIEESLEEVISLIRNARIAMESLYEETDTVKSISAVEKLLKCIRVNEIGCLREMLKAGNSQPLL